MEEPMIDIDTKYVKSMFHTGQYELNEDIVDGEFGRWLASVKAEALREAAAGFDFTTPDLDIWLLARADKIEQGD